MDIDDLMMVGDFHMNSPPHNRFLVMQHVTDAFPSV